MSAFLGPIHVQMYQRILYQQHLAKCLNPSLNRLFPDVELADIIDHQNIHGWLSQAVQEVNELYVQALENANLAVLFQEASQLAKPTTAKEALMIINQYSLDGMPCDKGLQLQFVEDNHVLFAYNPAVIPAPILDARLEWIKGLLDGTSIEVKRLSDTQFELKEGTC